jgi:acyl dehydratase
MRLVHGVEGLRSIVGEELGISDWHLVSQDRIDAFAAATEDYEPLHVDPKRAQQSPFGVTIAHGLYTLSLGPKCLYEIYRIDGVSLTLNYGYNRVRWLEPVRVNSRLRMRAALTGADSIAGGAKFTITETFEVDGGERPVCVAESIAAYFD